MHARRARGAPLPLASAQVEWLRARVQRIPVRLVFESALELMSSTQVGSFTMGGGGGGGKAPGPPPAVKKLLSMFGSGREEDKMVSRWVGGLGWLAGLLGWTVGHGVVLGRCRAQAGWQASRCSVGHHPRGNVADTSFGAGVA